MSKIDIRIFGVPERIENIRQSQSILHVPEDRIVIDHGRLGCFRTAQRAWGIYPDAEYVMVLQDDIVLSHDFLKTCETMIETYPDAIFGLYPGQFPRHEHIKRMPDKSPYVSTRELSGQAILMRSDYIYDCLVTWNASVPGDDVQIRNWAHATGKLILTTIPCIVQHLSVPSVFNPDRNIGSSNFFIEDPSSIDWANPYYTSWTNVSKR